MAAAIIIIIIIILQIKVHLALG